MRPKHCLFDVGRNMNYRIAKVKRNPSSDNHSVKLGNLENNLSIDSESFCHLFLEKKLFLKKSFKYHAYKKHYMFICNLMIKRTLRLSKSLVET